MTTHQFYSSATYPVCSTIGEERKKKKKLFAVKNGLLWKGEFLGKMFFFFINECDFMY